MVTQRLMIMTRSDFLIAAVTPYIMVRKTAYGATAVSTHRHFFTGKLFVCRLCMRPPACVPRGVARSRECPSTENRLGNNGGRAVAAEMREMVERLSPSVLGTALKPLPPCTERGGAQRRRGEEASNACTPGGSACSNARASASN